MGQQVGSRALKTVKGVAPGVRFFTFCHLIGLALLVAVSLTPHKQAGAQEATPAHLFITHTNSDTVPSIGLRLYGFDTRGAPLDFEAQLANLVINHGDQTATEIQVVGQEEVGTFTLFLLDTPAGVGEQLDEIQAAISQYAAEHFNEPVDRVAVYQVGERAAVELLAPTEFRNSLLNLFAESLPVQSGPTALVDSLMGLINSLEEITPNPAQAVSIVVFSDGTDAVSSQFQPAEVPAAAARRGIPIHTVLLANQNIAQVDVGASYLQQLSNGSGGIATALEDTAETAQIWERLALFQNQTLLTYRIPAPEGGEQAVLVSFEDAPDVQAGTTVTIPPTAPMIVFDVPAGGRTLTLPELEAPVDLVLPTTVSWLDGEERAVTQAQLLVNGQVVQDIDPENLANAPVTIDNFVYGANRVQISLVDAEVQRAVSPALVLQVNAGDARVIPEALQPPARLFGWVLTVVVLFLIAVAGFVYWRRRLVAQLVLQLFPKGGRKRRPKTPATTPNAPPSAYKPADRRPRTSVLDVLSSVSRMESPIELTGVEMRIGRSVSQSDITFENDITVSRVHATLVREGLDYRLFDEQSTSGTFVNDQPVPEYGTQLMNGDEIALGAVRLRYRKT